MAHLAVSALSLHHESSARSTTWLIAHQELSRLAKTRAALDWEEGRGLLAALRAEVHIQLGFGSFTEYVESLFGYKPRSIEEKLRVAEALETLPLLSKSLREGSLSWSAARELTRVATDETESAWCDAIRRMNIRQIEELVSGNKPGNSPHSPSDPALRKHVLAFEVCAETLATYREALARLRRDAGDPLDEETALLLMARQVLAGPRDTGRANYQIAFTLCEQCGRGFQEGCGERFEVTPDVLAMATCDAQYIGNVDPTPTLEDPAHSSSCALDVEALTAHVGATNSREPARKAQATRSEFTPTQTPHPFPTTPTWAPLDESKRNRIQTPPLRENATPRATQSIPPATRRLVLRRDSGRCIARVSSCRRIALSERTFGTGRSSAVASIRRIATARLSRKRATTRLGSPTRTIGPRERRRRGHRAGRHFGC